MQSQVKPELLRMLLALWGPPRHPFPAVPCCASHHPRFRYL